MKTLMTASLALMAMAAPAPPALAQGAATDLLSSDQAIEIATRKGMVYVLNIELDDGEWEIEGCTADGRELELDIHSHTGDIVKYELERETDDDCLPIMP